MMKRWWIICWVVLGVCLIFVGFLRQSFKHPPKNISASSPPKHSSKEIPFPPREEKRRGIHPNESHLYTFRLAEGEFVEGEVTQEGVDVVISITSPLGLMPPIDSRVVDRGPEKFWLLAKATGSYRIEINSPRGEGTYRFKVERRKANPRDFPLAEVSEKLHRARALAKDRAPDSRKQAFQLFLEVAAAWESLGENARQADALERAAELLEESAETAKKRLALRRKALDLYTALHDVSAMVRQWNSIGICQRDLKLPDLQQEALEKARRLAMDWGDPVGEAAAQQNLGLFWRDQGQPLRAILALEDALQGWRNQGSALGASQALTAMASIRVSYGDFAEARALYRRAAEEIGAQGDLRQRAMISSGSAVVLEKLGDPEAAKAEARRSLGLWTQLRNVYGQATTLTTLSLIHEALGDHRRARQDQGEALAIFRVNRMENEATIGTLNLGVLLVRQGYESQGIPLLDQALTEGRRLKLPEVEAIAFYGLARAWRGRNLALAIRNAEAAINIMEAERSRAVRDDLKASYLEARSGCYELLVDLLIAKEPEKTPAKDIARAFEMVDLQKSRNLLDSLVVPKRRMRADEQAARQKIQNDLAQILLKIENSKSSDGPLRDLHRDLDVALNSLSSFDASLAISLTPASPEPATLKSLQKSLHSDSRLLVYHLGSRRSFLFVVTRDQVQVCSLPPEQEIERVALSLNRQLRGSQRPRERTKAKELADKLGTLILDPARDMLKATTLVVVADGALQLVPFSLLTLTSGVEGRSSVLDHHAVVSLPSASVLEALGARRKRTPAPLGDLVIFATPKLLPGRRDLPDSQREVEAIENIVRPLKGIMIGKLAYEATKEVATSGLLRRFQVVHFATHAEIDDENPQLSRIVLTQVNRQGEPLDGYLSAYDIWSLEIPADMVVLSACETAQNRPQSGEGLLGLTQAFFHAGASSVLVSLWDVDDEATPDFMEQFYRGLYQNRLSPPEALRQAQLWMSHHPRWSSPYYWAGFELQGDWR